MCFASGYRFSDTASLQNRSSFWGWTWEFEFFSELFSRSGSPSFKLSHYRTDRRLPKDNLGRLMQTAASTKHQTSQIRVQMTFGYLDRKRMEDYS
jgi:hypothetical protein